MSKSMKEFGKDKSSPFNLPQEIVRREYPKQTAFNSDLDDTMTGIDEAANRGVGKVRKHLSHQH